MGQDVFFSFHSCQGVQPLCTHPGPHGSEVYFLCPLSNLELASEDHRVIISPVVLIFPIRGAAESFSVSAPSARSSKEPSGAFVTRCPVYPETDEEVEGIG